VRLLVTGANGQIGWELSRALLPLGEVISLGRAEFDLSRPASLRGILDKCRPDVIVNAAAYTAVDKAEEEEELATTVNGTAVGELAEWARRNSALLVHYSTDYVYDGTKGEPYVETDPTNPINAYGRSKLAGEKALAEIQPNFLCLRTSWVYANRGRNFFLTMLRLGAEREQLQVVADQFGAPNWAPSLADATAQIVCKVSSPILEGSFRAGIYHLSSKGTCSWHQFAEQIFTRARERHRDLQVREVMPIPSSAYSTPAARPRYSGLCSDALARDFQIRLPEWDVVLGQSVNNLTELI
jgi:dTDP-4-dehydrorhamnose reductase